MVDLEKDLSLKQQLLGVVILHKEQGKFNGTLPGDLDSLSNQDLLRYKILREFLDDWVLKELTGYYVNYRKQVNPSLNRLLPESQFQLYGVSPAFRKT